MKRIWSNKYVLIVNAISIMVAFLTHFPELITLSNPYSADGLSFPGMHWADVGNVGTVYVPFPSFSLFPE